MATVLLAWELGGGSGHLATLLPVAKGLRESGHRVFLAVQDLARASKVFGDLDVSYLQAPVHSRRIAHPVEPLRTIAHVLYNIGFGDLAQLRVVAGAWRTLLEYVRPDLCVFDHSPTALLAAHGLPARRALIGTGFACPADGYPLPDLRPWLGDAWKQLRKDEGRVLDNVNQVLVEAGQEPLVRLSQLWADVDETFLTTFPELDPYTRAQGGLYWGSWATMRGVAPQWPEGTGKRVFAYLKWFPALPRLLGLLNHLRCPTLIHGDGLLQSVHQEFESATLRFAPEPVDLDQVGAECDIAILNGTHGCTVSALLAGKPILQVPLYLEQALTGAAVARLGTGLVALPTSPAQIAGQFRKLLRSGQYAEAAGQFAQKYASFLAEKPIAKVVDRLGTLLRQGNAAARHVTHSAHGCVS